jgi:hypothetical protein
LGPGTPPSPLEDCAYVDFSPTETFKATEVSRDKGGGEYRFGREML